MELITLFFYLILATYAVFIGQLIFGYTQIKSFKRTNQKPLTTFSIIVPFRNEEKNLGKLLESISKLNYPKELFEIITVDDDSTDSSASIYNLWRFKNGLISTTLLENLRLSNSPKKDAISRAMHIVKNNWIVTTDADCMVNKNWLITLDNYIQKNNPEMIVGAVVYKTKNNWFHHFQQMDLMSLQATTIGSFGLKKPFMCNGANFAYTKKLFNELDGFNGNNKMASGDDVFLLQKATKKHLDKIHYLKNTNSIVKTKPENNLHQLFMQRVRWASKSSSYKSSYAKMLAIIVLLMNLSLVVGCWLLVIGFFEWKILVAMFLIKYCIDYILLFKANTFLQKGKFFLPLASSVLYPFYGSLVGIYSIFGSFSWKGRTFKK
jgi:cellulose synthase/poly-beta-1,6-N-acetylglucosamine synthase-like glycosyltransferase